MHGPPPDPRQVLLATGLADVPVAWLVSLLVGVALAAAGLWARRLPSVARGALLCLGLTFVLTAPALGLVDSAVLGSFPTIDKEGSLLFYLDGVHWRLLLHPIVAQADPAARLIGVHTGHLWVTEAFDLLLSPFGAMNAQGLMNMALGWGCMALLCRAVGAPPALAVALGLPFGLGLHVMRDLNFATIEKSAVFWLPLFGWSMLQSWRDGGRWTAVTALLYGLLSWMNLYLGLVAAAIGAMALGAELLASLGQRRLRRQTRQIAAACVACAVPGVVIAVWQAHVMAGGPPLGTPDQYLWQRAALDSLTLNPPRWNRLELAHALNPVAMMLAAIGLWRGRRDGLVQFALGGGVALALLALGPVLWWAGDAPQDGVHNPVYMAAANWLPGFWRVAKPEVFFEGTWMLLLAGGAAGLRDWRPWAWEKVAMVAAVAIAWAAMVRTHGAYPPFAEPQHSTLDAAWQDRVFPH